MLELSVYQQGSLLRMLLSSFFVYTPDLDMYFVVIIVDVIHSFCTTVMPSLLVKELMTISI